MNTPLPMSHIAVELAGKEGALTIKQLNALLDAQISNEERKKRSPKGLDKAAFDAVNERIFAINSAKLILKSVSLFHSAK